VSAEIHAAILEEGDTLCAEALLHRGGRLKAKPARQRARAVYHAMAGKVIAERARLAGRVQCVTHKSRRSAEPEVARDVAVRRDTSFGDLRDNVPHAVEEVCCHIRKLAPAAG
jgi:hypothetical protein